MTEEHLQEITQHTPHGEIVKATDLGDLFNAPEYASQIKETVDAQAQEGMSDDEKSAMADRREPFTIDDIELVATEYKSAKSNPDGFRWRIDIINQAGQERLLLLSYHPQRNGILESIRDRIAKTQNPVTGCVLHKLFKSQGNWFYVIKPWNA